VREVHDAGGRVIPWTVNKAEQAIALAALGVDALCTDFIPVLRSAL
jgi:glycerophosphoryl diester phosphodiesterase